MRKSSRKNLTALLSVFVLFVLSSCTGKKQPERVLRLSMLADAEGFDPAFCDSYYTHEAQGMIFEGLMEYEYLKRPHQLKPHLADGMPNISADGKTYTFKIKKGVRFSDHAAFPEGKGREVKAKDFVYSILRIADPYLNSTAFWLYDNHIVGLNEWKAARANSESITYDTPVAGLQALDDYTLQIKLKHKYPQLLFALAMPGGYVVAREVVEKTGKDFVNTPIGTGPYKLVSWVRNNKITYDRNPNWRGELYPSEGEAADVEKGYLKDAGKTIPFVDNLEIFVFTEEQPRWLNFVSGTTDIVRMPKDYYKTSVNPQTKELNPDLAAKGFNLHKVPETEVTYIMFNLEDPVIKKAGPNLRKAISLAMDHQKDLEVFYNNAAIMAMSPIPPGIAGYDPNFKNPYKETNLAKAKEYMAKAGYGPGKKLTLTYDTTQGTDGRQMSEKYQKELAEIGIDLKIQLNQFSELQKKQNDKRCQLVGIAWIADYPDAENFLQLLYGPNKSPLPNGANFDHPVFNKLFSEMRGMEDSPARRAIIAKMQNILLDEMPWIPGVHRIAHYVSSKRLKNYKAGSMGPFMPAKYMNLEDPSPGKNN